jgi:DNA-binding NarL/FixJ family response regulator
METSVAPEVVMKVVHIDQQRSYREALQLALWQQAGVGMVAHGDAFRPMLQSIEEMKPDLVVLDLLLKDTDGISAVRELRRRGCTPRTLILTGQHSELFVGDALHAGASGYAFKSESLRELIDALRLVASGQRYLSPHLPPLPEAAPFWQPHPTAPLRLQQLSEREREVFCHVIDGHSTRDIARVLNISPKTVEHHRMKINRKLGLHSPAQLVRFAAFSGLMEV